MQTTRFARIAVAMGAALSIFVGLSNVSAQAPYTPDVGNVGLPSNGAFHGGQIDTIQLNNGNLHIDIPLLHLPGIGMDSDFHFTYDSQIWNQATGPSSNLTNSPDWTLITMSRPPWQFKDPIAGYLKWGQHPVMWNCFAMTGNVSSGAQESNTDIDFTSFTDGDGTAHRLGINGILRSGSVPLCSVAGNNGSFPSEDANGNFHSYSGDDAGYHLTVDRSFNVVSLLDKGGKQYTLSAASNGMSGLPVQLAWNSCLFTAGTTEPCYANPAGAVETDFASVASVEDSDGNKISGLYNSTGSQLTITDTANRTITETLGSGCTIPQTGLMRVGSEAIGRQPCAITYTDQNGNAQKITITYGTTAQITTVPSCAVSESNSVPQNMGCGGQIETPFAAEHSQFRPALRCRMAMNTSFLTRPIRETRAMRAK